MKFLSGFREMPLSQKLAYKWLEHFHGGAESSKDKKNLGYPLIWMTDGNIENKLNDSRNI
jgi:hypothetical protein